MKNIVEKTRQTRIMGKRFKKGFPRFISVPQILWLHADSFGDGRPDALGLGPSGQDVVNGVPRHSELAGDLCAGSLMPDELDFESLLKGHRCLTSEEREERRGSPMGEEVPRLKGGDFDGQATGHPSEQGPAPVPRPKRVAPVGGSWCLPRGVLPDLVAGDMRKRPDPRTSPSLGESDPGLPLLLVFASHKVIEDFSPCLKRLSG